MKTKDPNGTVHEYVLDKAGRPQHDRVTTLGSGVDNAVLRLSTTYDIRGLAEKLTSYDNATVGSGNVVNEVVREYDDSGNLAKEYQEHAGAKTANTLYVEYNHDTTAASGVYTKGLRPTSVRYPNGRLVHTTYGTANGTNDVLSRPFAINEDSSGAPGAAVAEYTYLGAGAIVKEDFPEPDLRLDYDSGTAGEYAGLDRFDRIVDQLWRDYGSSTDAARLKYGYDRLGNRLYREDTVAKAQGTPVYLDEHYGYDDVNQLTARDRGQLNGNKDAISGTPGKEEDWTLDMTGNWTGFVQKTNGTTDLNQTRTQNAANEITAISTPTTSLAYDRNGNMKTVLGGIEGWWTDWTLYHYDAWNRPVDVRDGSDTYSYRRYAYDALNRRVRTAWDDGYSVYEYYYNAGWQLLEEHLNWPGETLIYDRQYVWGLRYIDEPILRDRNSDGDPQSGDLGFAGSGYDERLYAMQDANFNVVALTDTSGDVVERVTYSAYGVPTFLTPSFGNRGVFSDYEWALLFTGQLRDWALATYHYRNRDYSPLLGRFISRDPIGYWGATSSHDESEGDPTATSMTGWEDLFVVAGMEQGATGETQDANGNSMIEANLYRYVGNSPLTLTDPAGQVWWWPPDWWSTPTPPPSNPPVNVPIRPVAGPNEASTAVKAATEWAKIQSAHCEKAAQCAALRAAIAVATGVYRKNLTEIYTLNCMGANLD